MKLKVVVHDADEGGYWAEVPVIPGCATEGDTFEELLQHLYEAIEGCLSVDVEPTTITSNDRVLEIAICGPLPGRNSPLLLHPFPRRHKLTKCGLSRLQ